MSLAWDVRTLKYSGHALRQMFARRISEAEVSSVIAEHDIVADYPQEIPFPSRLLLGFSENRPIHIVIGYNAEKGEGVIVTAYEPDLALWEPDFKSRRAK